MNGYLVGLLLAVIALAPELCDIVRTIVDDE